MKIGRDGRDLAADLLQCRDVDAGLATPRIVALASGDIAGPAAVEPIRLVCAVALRGLELDIEVGPPVRFYLLDFGGADDAFADELLAVHFERGRMAGDGLVHQGLGE